MCLGIPMQVLEVQGALARCTGRNGEARIDTLLVGTVQPGDWLLTHLNTAREIIDAERARLVDDALDALAAVTQNSGSPEAAQSAIDLAFADLIDREPSLPPHLQALLNKETP